MLSTLRAASSAARVVAVRRTAAPLRAVASFHSSAAAHEEEKTEPWIPKDNPIYLPNNWDDWENVGYKNLAPKGHRGWEDLPAPYKYYHIKMDPKDVETHGPLFQIMTNWKTALPVTALLATPMFLYDIFVLDARTQLALIFWSTIAILKQNVGPMIGDAINNGAEEVRKEVLKIEANYRESLTSSIEAHANVMGLDDDLRMRHEAERALKAVEAEALTREIRVEQVHRMKDMLEYMVMVNATASEGVEAAIDAAAMSTTESALGSDKKLQQASIDDALTAMEDDTYNLFGSTVANHYVASLEAEIAKAESGADDAAAAERRREVFGKKFGFAPAVTADMLKGARDNPKAAAVLRARAGGADPVEGTPLTDKMPIDF